VRVLEHQNAVAYSVNHSWGRTYSNLFTPKGVVAMKRSDLEQGTRVVILGQGGEVLGCCVVGDTGTLANHDVDILLDTHREACWFGEREVTILALDRYWGG
ncbi:MAG: hypothetical protein LBJ38_01500, partial [Oscillospiraceae bacterium]|jgi:3D (Asp-Asp-Asp) domain-containing protein|nr:hypothetical protein [Oscillospiraceae bacterium]